MGFTTKNGVEITDSMMDEIAEAFERGEWPGSETRVLKGRPPLFRQKMKSVTYKDTAAEIEAMDRRAASLDMSRSDYLRHLVRQDLASIA